MKLAFVFPGQGARNLLSGIALARRWPEGARLVERAIAATKLSAAEVEGQAGRALERTEVLQPVLVAVALAIHRALERADVTPALTLGHSLGELSALAAAGGLDDAAAVSLAALRGSLMAREASNHPGGLLALSSLEVAQKAVARGGVEIAAFNAPDEVVVGGKERDLRAIASEFSGKRVAVSGAWHTSAMAGAVEEFATSLRALPGRKLVFETPGSLASLAEALTRPVRFSETLATAIASGIDTFVTVGPGAVLRGLIRRNLGSDIRILTTEDAADFDRTIHTLAGAA